MRALLQSIEDLKKSEIKDSIDARMREFKENGEETSHDIFKELCFCILTAYFDAEKSIKIQKEIDDGFLTLQELQLAKKLKELGHRYPNIRAKYIVKARQYKDSLRHIIFGKSFGAENELREWLVENVGGIGYKEASHFLRNIGYSNFAILDFHILNILEKYKLVEKPGTLTKAKYLEIEDLLKEIAGKSGLSLAQLDLYLWYMETGKILK